MRSCRLYTGCHRARKQVAKRNNRVKPDPELVKLADSLLANYQKPEDLIGENGLLKQLTKMLVERALETEMSEHLGHGNVRADGILSHRAD
ncbi:hypothetical protein LMG28140_05521 [Paraburkholderia metrosideri]|uniref:Transposase n=1 Tax=Paraburkholderia metrosideri TaxID=580937 RepID=A0ABM8P2M5_9BURK|nr:hypothetical protein LMG28140_05521 [Paraburkholderia metrosideri]